MAASVAVMAAGLVWGTYVAGGPDSYCYLHQAELLSTARLGEFQPIVRQVPWPKAGATFTPIGHLPSASDAATIVPACPAGYPMLMALAHWIGGRAAMFVVVPLLGGLAIWLTFLLGRSLVDDVVGLVAVLILASSPAFLYQLVQPMTDVPAMTFWTASLVAALASSGKRPGTLCGLLTGAALLVRPNLVPLAGVIAGSTVLDRPIAPGRAVRALATFAGAVLPFVIATMVLNSVMHGGPMESGYGRLSDLFTVAHIRGNLARYPVWLVETQTPLILLSILAPLLLRRPERRRAWWLLAFALATFACYIPYTVWDAWWFLRFVLPAFPALVVLTAAAGLRGIERLRPEWRTAVLAMFLTFVVGFQIRTAAVRAVFELRDLEARFRDAGEYVARRLPPTAVVLAVTESGSVRFYSGRLTLFWSSLDPAWLDRAISWLESAGYRPYLLFEQDEELPFRDQFGKTSVYASLDWPPTAEIDQDVHIYDPLDRDRYLKGGNISTDVVWKRAR